MDGSTAGDPTAGPSAGHVATGWLFVLAQFALLVILIALPGGDAWPVPTWLSLLGYALMAAGAVVGLLAALHLGPGLTPTPVPTERGRLTTGGMYRYSRHPIYSGVLLLVIGLVVKSGNVITLLVGLATIAFFTVKAGWEEQRLRERYPGYDAYAATVARFGPRLR